MSFQAGILPWFRIGGSFLLVIGRLLVTLQTGTKTDFRDMNRFIHISRFRGFTDLDKLNLGILGYGGKF